MKNRKLIIIRIILLAIGIIVSSYLYMNTITGREGLEYIFMLPIAGSFVASALLGEASTFDKIGICFYLFVIILYTKYIMMPLVLTISNGYLHYMRDPCSKGLNQYAVFILIVELITIYLASMHYLKKYKNIGYNKIESQNTKLYYTTTITIGLLILICILRYKKFIDQIHFGTIQSRESLGSYEQIVLQVIKSYIYVRLVIFMSECYNKRKNIFYIFLSIIFCGLNCVVFFGVNRSLIFQTAFASITILINQFHKQKKLIFTTIFPLVIISLIGISATRHFDKEVSELDSDTVNIEFLSTTFENYTCGPWSITNSLYAADLFKDRNGFNLIVADFVCNFFPFMIPGINHIRDYYIQSEENTSILFNSTIHYTGSMIPLIGEATFYFGFELGFIMDILLIVFITKVLIESCIKSVNVKSTEMQFYYAWLSSLFAFSTCYCLITFLWSWSKFGMLFLILSLFNSLTQYKAYKEVKDQPEDSKRIYSDKVTTT